MENITCLLDIENNQLYRSCSIRKSIEFLQAGAYKFVITGPLANYSHLIRICIDGKLHVNDIHGFSKKQRVCIYLLSYDSDIIKLAYTSKLWILYS